MKCHQYFYNLYCLYRVMSASVIIPKTGLFYMVRFISMNRDSSMISDTYYYYSDVMTKTLQGQFTQTSNAYVRCLDVVGR